MDNMESYANSFQRRPNELGGGGRGLYCCIPLCGSASYHREMNKSSIGFFKFPDENKFPEQRKKWIGIITQFRRKGLGDSFQIKSTTRVCEFHFNSQEIKVSAGVGRKTLQPGVFPTVFKFRDNPVPKKRKSPAERIQVIEESSESEYEDDNTDLMGNLMPLETEADMHGHDENVYYDVNYCCREKDVEITRLNLKITELEADNIQLQEKVTSLKSRIFNFENIAAKPELFKKLTGFGLDKFNYLQEFLNPGKNCENIKFYEPGDSYQPSSMDDTSSSKKRGPKPKIKPTDQLFLFLIWLKCGLTLHFTSWLFDTPKSTVSRYIITWVNFLYYSLGGSVSIWPSKQQIIETMPEIFRKTYPSTRCIIDCTELFCQRPSSLTIQSALYSSYKHHVTYKGLVGISPSGAITFVSQLYEGSISDKEIVSRSGILTKELWSPGDSLMADRGFDIQDLLSPLQVNLNIPAFLSGRPQLSKAEVKESQCIASVRIHVERAIQRIKKFRQIRCEVPLSLHGSINQIWTVACLLCNFLPPLIQKDFSISVTETSAPDDVDFTFLSS